jgi:hypothetical protein
MIYKIGLIIFTILNLSLIGIADYYYYNSFYHFLLTVGIIVISYIGYIINNKISSMLRIYIKWLGI